MKTYVLILIALVGFQFSNGQENKELIKQQKELAAQQKKAEKARKKAEKTLKAAEKEQKKLLSKWIKSKMRTKKLKKLKRK